MLYPIQLFTLFFLLRVQAEDVGDCDSDRPPLYTPECCEKASTIFPETFKKQSCFMKFPPPLPPSLLDDTPPPPPTLEIKKKHACIQECLFKENGMIDGEGKIIGEKLTEVFTTTLDKGLTDTVTAAIAHCLETVEEVKIDGSEKDKDCNRRPDEIMQCITREMILNCPASLAKGSMCEETKDLLPKCPQAVTLLRRHPPTPPPPPYGWSRLSSLDRYSFERRFDNKAPDDA